MKRFNFGRIMLSIVLLLVATFALVACTPGETDQELLDAAAETIGVVYGSGDSSSSVTSDITLPTTVGGYDISWTSSNTDVIANDGSVVARPETDTEVTLTASITLNEATATASFTVTVIADDTVDPQDVLDAITLTGDDVTPPSGTVQYYIATGDITLPTSDQGLTISWSSGNTDVIANDGTVTRPLKDDGDIIVILTATVETVTAQFAVQVPELAEYTDDQKLDAAYTALQLSGVDAGVVTASLTLPETVGTQNVTVTWSSSDTDHLANDGTISRPTFAQGPAAVVLTATLTSGDQTRDKVFNLTIASKPEPVYTGTIAGAFDEATYELGAYIRLQGVTIIDDTGDGYGLFVVDATGTMFVYGATLGEFSPGDVVDIEGYTAQYYNAYQLTGEGDNPIYMEASDAAATTITYDNSSITAVNALAKPSTDAKLQPMLIHLEAKVLTTGDGNYDVFLVPLDHEGDLVKSESIMIYYHSNIGAIRDMAGQKIIVDVIVMAYRTNDTVWTAVFLGEAEDIDIVPLTDAEAVAAAVEANEGFFDYEYIEAETLTLPATDVNDVAITWASESAYFDEATGDITMPATGHESVEVTATFTKGAETEDVVYTFQVGEIDLMDISAVIAMDNGHFVRVQGVVTSSEYQNTYFIQDSTGGIAVYTYDDSDLETFLNNNYGNVVNILAKNTSYGGLNQIVNPAEYTFIEAGTMPTPMDITDLELDEDALAMYQGQLVTITDLVVTDVYEDSYGNVTLTLFDVNSLETIRLKWDSRVTLGTTAADLLDSIAVNDVVNVTTPLAWSYGPFLYFTDSTDVTVVTKTDAELVALAKALLETAEFEAEYNEAVTLVLPSEYFGVAITWASESMYIDEATGDVTMPAFGRETVTLNGSLTKGTESDTVAIEFVVGVQLISAIYEGEEDDVFTVEGTVVGTEFFSTWFIQDESGAIAIYEYDSDLRDTINGALGKIIRVTGEKSIYRDLVELNMTAVTVVSETGDTYTPMNLDMMTLDTAIMDYQSQMVELTHLVVSEVDVDSYGNTTVYFKRADGEMINMKWDSRVTLSTEAQALIDGVEVGDVLDVTAILGWYNTPRLFFTEETMIVDTATPTDEELLLADSAVLSFESSYAEAMTLTLAAAGTNGSAIVWSSDNEAVINSTTGDIVLPAEDTDVILTATLTLGTDELIVTFDITVVAPVVQGTPELFFSEYIEGGSYNKAIEIYNPTGATVDLSDYSLDIYMNGATESSGSVTLSGNLASGDVFVVYNSGSIVAISDEGDLSNNTIANFNGDDVVTLSKNGVMIDSFGVVGNTNGNDFAKDKTFVRNATIVSGNTTYTVSEWTEYAKDTTDYIGSHTCDEPSS